MSRNVARIVSLVSLAALVLLAVAWFAARNTAPSIHVRWREGLAVEDQKVLERRFALVRPEHLEGQTWAYDLLDTSRRNVEGLVKDPDVDDTHEIDRKAFLVRPEAPRGRTQVWWVHRLDPRFLPSLMPGIVVGLVVTWLVSTWLSLRKRRAA